MLYEVLAQLNAWSEVQDGAADATATPLFFASLKSRMV